VACNRFDITVIPGNVVMGNYMIDIYWRNFNEWQVICEAGSGDMKSTANGYT
jgi:hypothetical protein